MIPETVTATPGEESSDALQLIDQMGEFFADPLADVLPVAQPVELAEVEEKDEEEEFGLYTGNSNSGWMR